MNKPRKPLTEILDQFEESPITPSEDLIQTETSGSEDSLIAKLAVPKNKPNKIRFTLDLEKPLDNRLSKIAKKLNRTKADITRIALEQLLTQLEAEINK